MKTRLFILIFALTLPFLLMAIIVNAADVTLQWGANQETDLAGYKVYYDKDAGAPYVGSDAEEGLSPIIIPIGDLSDSDNPEFTLTKLSGYDNHYFAVTAYDFETPSLESDYSNEVTTERIYEEGPPTKPKNLKRIWKVVKRFFKWFNPWKPNLRIISRG